MAKKIDWDYWRRKYIQGMDLIDISQVQDAPSYSTLRTRSSKENWPEQRQRFRHNATTIASTVPEAQDVVSTVNTIIDSAEMLTRHSRACKLIGSIAMKAFQSYDPASLKPSEAVSMMRLALEYERLTEGHATQRQELDMSGLSNAELENIAKGA